MNFHIRFFIFLALSMCFATSHAQTNPFAKTPDKSARIVTAADGALYVRSCVLRMPFTTPGSETAVLRRLHDLGYIPLRDERLEEVTKTSSGEITNANALHSDPEVAGSLILLKRVTAGTVMMNANFVLAVAGLRGVEIAESDLENTWVFKRDTENVQVFTAEGLPSCVSLP